jgi:hypothetical protein
MGKPRWSGKWWGFTGRQAVPAISIRRAPAQTTKRPCEAMPDNASPPYDPRARQPRTLGELERWFLAAAASDRGSAISPPISLHPPPPGLRRLAAYCKVKYGKLSYENVGRLISEYVLVRDVSDEEAKQATFEEAADTFAPRPGSSTLSSTGSPASTPTGPEFNEADFHRALAALDLCLQDYNWQPGENHLTCESLLGVLQAKQITLALAQELFRRLNDQGVFTPNSQTIPAGYSYEKGVPLPICRLEPETTHCWMTTQERWYGYLAASKRPPALVGNQKPPNVSAYAIWSVEELLRLEKLYKDLGKAFNPAVVAGSPAALHLVHQQQMSQTTDLAQPEPTPATPTPAPEPQSFTKTAPLELFFSYSHKDERLRNKLATHLSQLKNDAMITDWHDRKIGAGTEWKSKIDEHLNNARIILLLVSADFLASGYCYDIEMKRAMERHEARDATVIPVILKPCDWHTAPFGKLLGLPTDARPITEWGNRESAFTDVARGIRAAVRKITGPS